MCKDEQRQQGLETTAQLSPLCYVPFHDVADCLRRHLKVVIWLCEQVSHRGFLESVLP